MKRLTSAVAAFAILLAGQGLAAEVKGPVHLSGAGHEDHDDLAEARLALNEARTAVDETSRDFARIEAGDWSGTMTIEGDKVIKCGNPAEYPELDCVAYTDAEKAEMRANMAKNLAESRAGLVEAEAALSAAEKAASR